MRRHLEQFPTPAFANRLATFTPIPGSPFAYRASENDCAKPSVNPLLSLCPFAPLKLVL